MLLALDNVHKRFGALTVADDISIAVRAGQAVGVIGPNGAGKTSLFNLISGDLKPSGGSISFDGRDVTAFSSRRRAHSGIARTYQIPLPFGGLTLYENVLVAATFAHPETRKNAAKRAAQTLEFTGLAAKANQLASAAPLLDRKRLELARALATQPKLLMLDEIAGGLSEVECLQLIELIKAIHVSGVTVIWIEHIVHALIRVVERLIVLDRGHMIADGKPQAVMSSAQVRDIYLGVEPDAEAA